MATTVSAPRPGTVVTSLRLVSGESRHVGWTFRGTDPRTLMRVGAGDECTWQISADGVSSTQLFMLWDGYLLTVFCAGGRDVLINGNTLSRPANVMSGQISFGGATIVVESGHGWGVRFGVPISAIAGTNDSTLAPALPAADARRQIQATSVMAQPRAASRKAATIPRFAVGSAPPPPLGAATRSRPPSLPIADEPRPGATPAPSLTGAVTAPAAQRSTIPGSWSGPLPLPPSQQTTAIDAVTPADTPPPSVRATVLGTLRPPVKRAPSTVVEPGGVSASRPRSTAVEWGGVPAPQPPHADRRARSYPTVGDPLQRSWIPENSVPSRSRSTRRAWRRTAWSLFAVGLALGVALAHFALWW
jgi:hypothetical protein